MFFFSTFVTLLVATSSLMRNTTAFPLYGGGALEVRCPFLQLKNLVTNDYRHVKDIILLVLLRPYVPDAYSREYHILNYS